MGIAITSRTPRDLIALVEATDEAHPTVVLVGAGVSMVAPTDLPSGLQLLDRAVGAVVTSPRPRAELDSVRDHERWATLVPEVILQRIEDVGGALPFEAFAGMATADPNPLHAWLARLGVGRGHRIATTNFDELVEGQDDERRSEVLHLHGRIGDRPGMVATIRRVGRGLAPDVLARWEDLLTASGRLVALGYSGNDRDVMDLVEAHAAATVLWCVRSDEDWALRNLAELGRRTDVEAVVCDLAAVAAELAPPRPPTARPASTPWPAVAPLTEALQLEVVAGALQTMDLHARSIDTARSGLASWREDPTGVASLSVLLAHALNRTDDQTAAVDLARWALGLAPEGDLVLRVRLHTEAGLAALDSVPPDLASARVDLRWAEEQAKELPVSHPEHDRRLGIALHNRGYVETVAFMEGQDGDLDLAARLYRSAAEHKRRAGDLIYLQASLRNGAAVLRVIGDEDGHRAMADKFLALADRYSLRWSRAYLPTLTGWLWSAAGRWDDARPLLEEGLRLYRDLGETPMVTKIEARLAARPPIITDP